MKDAFFQFRPWVCFAACFLICISSVWSSPFEEGNTLFKEGKFAEAEMAYSRSLAQEGDSPATRYNLGKVREALADPARGMLEWERALRLAPDYVPALKALEAARTTMGSKVAPPTWWQKLQPQFTFRREIWVAALGIWMLSGGILLGLATKSRALAGSLIGTGTLIALFGFSWVRHAHEEAEIALVLERSVVLRAAPANPARALDSLPAGSRLRLLDQSGGWQSGVAADGQIGWVPSSSIERISP